MYVYDSQISWSYRQRHTRIHLCVSLYVHIYITNSRVLFSKNKIIINHYSDEIVILIKRESKNYPARLWSWWKSYQAFLIIWATVVFLHTHSFLWEEQCGARAGQAGSSNPGGRLRSPAAWRSRGKPQTETQLTVSEERQLCKPKYFHSLVWEVWRWPAG